MEIQHQNLFNVLAYTTQSKKGYRGKGFDTGYHTLKVAGQVYQGQRNPAQRLANVPYDFTNKSVLDIGANQGGMLFELADKISFGVGTDFDYKLINVANKIAQIDNKNNLSFFVHNVDEDPLSLLNDFNKNEKYDIVFVLAVCMWITKWKELMTWVKNNSNHCLFESNGNKQQQREQIEFLNQNFSEVKLINEQSFDDPNQKNRKLYLCKV